MTYTVFRTAAEKYLLLIIDRAAVKVGGTVYKVHSIHTTHSQQ